MSRCSATKKFAPRDLKTHIKASHIQRVALPCPFRSCFPQTAMFTRQLLVEHFHKHHSKLVGTSLSGPSDLLKPTLSFVSPSRRQLESVDRIFPSHTLTTPAVLPSLHAKNAGRHVKRLNTPERRSIKHEDSLKLFSPARPQMLTPRLPSVRPWDSQTEADPSEDYEFEPIVRPDPGLDLALWLESLLVVEARPADHFVSGPQPVITQPFPVDPPISMHFEDFAKKAAAEAVQKESRSTA